MIKRIQKHGLKLAVVVGIAGIASYAFAATSKHDNLVANEFLFPNQYVDAFSCGYQLNMQPDGNLVTYARNTTSGGGISLAAKWSSGTGSNVGGYAAFQGDGNFVIYNWNDTAVWNTATSGHPGSYLKQQDDANLVVYSGTQAMWQSGKQLSKIGANCPIPSGIKTKVIGNVDRLGGDFRDIVPRTSAGSAVNRASFCGFYCAQDSACKAYTFVPSGVKDGNPHCYLKNTVPATTPHTGFVSGEVVTPISANP